MTRISPGPWRRRRGGGWGTFAQLLFLFLPDTDRHGLSLYITESSHEHHSEIMHLQGRSWVSALMAGLLLVASCAAVRIVHPAEDERLEFIPDIPLWVRLEKAEGECFDILLDGVSQTISCEVDTVLSAKPQPGPHRIEVVPTFRPSSLGPMASASFHVYRDESSSNSIPPSMASADG